MADEAVKPPLRLVRELSPGEQSDEALVLAHLKGDSQAFEALVRRHERAVLRLAYRFARDRDQAEELAQRTFLQAFASLSRMKPGTPFNAWLFRVASNLCKNHLRDRARLLFQPVPELGVDAPGEQQLIAEEQRRAVRDALRRLPLRQRQVVSLRIDAELSFAELAEALGITENNAKVCYHLALKRLRHLLGTRGAS